MLLVERPHPRLGVMNVQRVVHGKHVTPELIEEVSELEVLTSSFRDLATKRLEAVSSEYRLAKILDVTPRVKELTFKLNESVALRQCKFRPLPVGSGQGCHQWSLRRYTHSGTIAIRHVFRASPNSRYDD